MWQLSDSEQKTVREFIAWLVRDSIDYALCDSDLDTNDNIAYNPLEEAVAPEVLAAYVRWREVLSEQD
jgi:hypothetical protein